jgi:hypothetical protein
VAVCTVLCEQELRAIYAFAGFDCNDMNAVDVNE